MPASVPSGSARRSELLERAYRYVLEHGVADVSLRPLAAAVESSPRVLLYLFGSKTELIQALLTRARADELELLARVRSESHGGNLASIAAELWRWLAAEEHRALLTLWVEGYARSLIDPDGVWSHFARATVSDWLEVLADAQPRDTRDSAAGVTERTLVLAVLRGALLDLLATGAVERVTDAVATQLILLRTIERAPGIQAQSA